MTGLTEFLTQSTNWLWFIIAGILMILELAIPGLFLIWLAVGAMVTGLLLFVIPVALSWQAQTILFALLSVLMVIIGKKFLGYGDFQASDNHNLNKRGHRLLGTIITVEQLTSADKGKAKIGDSYWTIIGDDLVVGAQMSVVEIEGNALIVEPLNSNN